MKLPFNLRQFLDVFRQYNLSIWPAQIILNILALVAVILIFSKFKFCDKSITIILSILWAWTALAYHYMQFSKINPASKLFGTFVLIQALLFIFYGAVQNKMVFHAGTDLKTVIGIGLILYALLIYPALGMVFGHKYPYSPTFGAPCPTTIFTIGMFFMLSKPFPRVLLVVPILWSIIGGSAAIILKIREDFGLILSGLFALLLAFGM
jgi:hypothetical protein